LDQGALRQYRGKLEGKVNIPTAPDYIAALEPWTGPAGHPFGGFKQMLKLGFAPFTDVSQFEGVVALQVTSAADIDKKWPQFLAEKPDFVKLELLFTENYEQRIKDPSTWGARGLSPEMATELVKRAHRAGLRTGPHVVTAGDFHYALTAGVDYMAHIPLTEFGFVNKGGFVVRSFLLNNNYLSVIAENDAQLAGQRRVPVITTVVRAFDVREVDPQGFEQVERDVIVPNLRMLKKWNVPLIMGTDDLTRPPGKPPVCALAHEVIYIAGRGVYSPLEVLKAATEDTPRFIFPERKIGALQDGYEASFLVLSGDPLEKMDNIRSIEMRFKKGHKLSVWEQK